MSTIDKNRSKRERDHNVTFSKRSKREVKEKEAAKKDPVWGNSQLEEECDENQRNIVGEDVREEEKAKADFGLSGALSKDTVTGNVYNGVILKWTEPLDAKVPYKGWRLYVFKDNEVVETLHLHHQSAFLFGREARVADHVLGHASCSQQHAVIQFRKTNCVKDEKSSDVTNMRTVQQVRPYIMDLKSSNKTLLNGKPIEDSRFIELRHSDVIKFGYSTREYVLLNENFS